MSETLQYKRGDVMQFSTGSYSDHRYIGLLVAIKDVDLIALAHRFQREFTPQEDDWRDTANPDDFPGWLVANEYAVPVMVADVFLGSYGWDEEFRLPEFPPC